MKVLIYGLNYAPEKTGIGKYSGEMGGWLVTNGHDVKAVTAPPYYPAWKLGDNYKNSYSNESVAGVDVFRCPLYIPASPTTVKRLLHLLSFAISSIVPLLYLLRWRPAVVVNVVPTLFTSAIAWLYCVITRAKLVVHVQDFEGDAMFGLGMAKKGVLSFVWFAVERFLLRRARLITTISNAMVNIAISKGVDSEKVALFPNWSETERFVNVTGIDAYKMQLGLPLDKNIVLYSGNIGAKQGLELVVELAEQCEANPEYLFVICGEGTAKVDLMEKAAVSKLNNMVFLPLQQWEMLPKLLAMASVHLVVQKAGVADVVLPSKLTNILAVGGNAVITADAGTEMGLLASRFPNIVKIVAPESVGALYEGVRAAIEMDQPNNVAIAYAENYLSKDKVLAAFVTSLVKVM